MDSGARIPIRPSRLSGNWCRGYVLDRHIISSDYRGHDASGRPRFDTKRTELGELLYGLKYNSDSTVLDQISEVVVSFVRKWNPPCDVIVPVPPSKANREVQPVLEIARRVSERLQWELMIDGIRKIKATTQLKDIDEPNKRTQVLKGAFGAGSFPLVGRKVLLLDDLYDSGVTMKAVTAVLLTDCKVASVRVLALTRTRRRS